MTAAEKLQEIPTRKISLLTASKVRTERLDWLIDNWVPRKSLTLLAGREGLGKSTIACGIAAQATRGELNPDAINVAYLNTEDSRSITVKPRLEAANADLDRVYFIDVTTEEGNAGSLTLPGDTSLLEKALVEADVKLVILDAAKSAMHSKLDGYRDDDVRQFLEPLAAMCERNDIAIIGLVHFGKRESSDPGKLILGSVAWSQIARSVLSVAIDEEGGLVVTNTKGNLAPAQISREARLESVKVHTDDGKVTEVGRIVWGDETNVSAADLLVSNDSHDEDDRTEAEAWLEDYLTVNGATPRADVFRAAKKYHVASEATIKRAFKKLGGVSESSGFPRVSTWSLPSRITPPQTTPRALDGDPTEPTGLNQGKRNDPTERKTQLDHTQKCEPTGEKITLEAVKTHQHKQDLTELESIIIGSLHGEYSMTLRTVQQSAPALHREHVQGVLQQLIKRGAVIEDRAGKFLLNSERKAS